MKLSILFFIVFFFGFIGFGIMHEQVHIEIYRSYGIESHVEYLSHFPDLVTIAEEPCPTEMCRFAHNLNEIIGYPLSVLYLVFGIFCWIIIILKEYGLYEKY